MPQLPIDAFKDELVTILEFIRVAQKGFPSTTDKILTHMDLSDEAFLEAANTLAAEVSFDFDDDGTDDDNDD